MTETAVEAGTDQLLGTPCGELVLRVIGGPRDGHVVRLNAVRCSIGSSDRCTLRLRGAGIRPLHCVILRGAEKMVIRRWAPGTLLNGRDFSDATLSPGDRLTVGPVCFEVVACETEEHRPEPAIDFIASTIQDHQHIEHLSARLDVANRQGRRRARQLLEHARGLRQRVAELSAPQPVEPDFEAREAEYEARRREGEQKLQELLRRERELDQRAEEIARRDEQRQHRLEELDRRDAKIEQRNGQLNDREQELNRRAEQAARSAAEFDQRAAAWEQERRDRESRLADTERTAATRVEQLDRERSKLARDADAAESQRQCREAELAAAQARCEEQTREVDARWQEYHEARRALDEERNAWEQSRADASREAHERLEDELRSKREELDAREQALESRAAELLANETALIEAKRQFDAEYEAATGAELTADTCAEEIRFEAASDEAPLSAAAVLSRLGSALPDEGEAANAANDLEPPRHKKVVAPGGVSPAPSESGASDESDDDIQSYMARLMERVGGKGNSTPPVAAPAERQAQPKVEEAPARPVEPVVRPQALKRLPPRVAPIQLSADLAKMRDLANENVRTALDDHFRRKIYYTTISKASVAGAGFAAGLIMLWWASLGAPIARYLSAISFTVAIVWLLQYGIALNFLLRTRRAEQAAKCVEAQAVDLVIADEANRCCSERGDTPAPSDDTSNEPRG